MGLELFFRKTRAKIGSITLDASLQELHSGESEITDHPVEDGTNVTDNIRDKPDRVRIEGMVTNHPLNIEDRVDSVGALVRGEAGRAETAFEQLREIKKNKQTVTIITSLKTYDNMAMETFEVPRDAELGNVVKFTATFKEIIIAKSETRAAPSKGDVGKAKVSSGKKPTVPAPPPVAGKSSSILFDWLL
jgi:hypothetical protein